jgi:mannose-1-phosphate guanylyltransferase
VDRPKQFFRLRGESLLQRTLRRSGCIADPDRTVAVVRHEHRQWWQNELCELPAENVLAESGNLGTAVAILHALVHALQQDDDPTLVVLPSDHAAESERTLIDSACSAARLAAESREHLVLLGVTAEGPETQYGWILPRRPGSAGLQEVERFVEKPDAEVAAALLADGGLWNSFIFAGSARALLGLFEARHPYLLRTCIRAFRDRGPDESQQQAPLRELPRVEFCGDVLQSAVARLRVLPVPACGWTDLGTPQRVHAWLERSTGHLTEPSIPSA